MSEKIVDIKKKLEYADMIEREKLLQYYKNDTRAGVIKLVNVYEKKKKEYQKELERTNKMKEFETNYQSYSFICGIDEAGRGPLAGPVVAGAVILDPDDTILYLNDSKKLTEKKREELYKEIKKRAVSCAAGVISSERIDEVNILQATYQAMRAAVFKLGIVPDLLLNDAVVIPKLQIKQVGIIKGDARSISIAAASIIAKVTRDHIMEEYDTLYPEYGFSKHKGYGTKEHIEAIQKYGPCPIHRKSFIRNIKYESNSGTNVYQ